MSCHDLEHLPQGKQLAVSVDDHFLGGTKGVGVPGSATVEGRRGHVQAGQKRT